MSCIARSVAKSGSRRSAETCALFARILFWISFVFGFVVIALRAYVLLEEKGLIKP